MARENEEKESHIRRMIEENMLVVEHEYGVWGLDFVVELVEARRFAAIQEQEANRHRSE